MMATSTSRRVEVSSCRLARARSPSRTSSRFVEADRKASKRVLDSPSSSGVAALGPLARTEAMSGSAAVWRHSAARWSVSFRAAVSRGSRRIARWMCSMAAASSARPLV